MKALQDGLHAAVLGALLPRPGKPCAEREWVVVAAQEGHLEGIASWRFETGDARWVGVPGGAITVDVLRTWLREALLAVVVVERDESAGQGPPVAFASLTLFNDRSIEVGRLVVLPQERFRGLGASLTQHLARTAIEALIRTRARVTEIVARVARDNEFGRCIVRSLPFDALPASRSPDDDTYTWFRYRTGATTGGFAAALRSVRQDRQHSQAELAFLSGVHRPTLNMIETGRRLPSPALLRFILSALDADAMTVTKLLHALVGREPDAGLRLYQTFLNSGSFYAGNLAVFSDIFAELRYEGSLQQTWAALQSGHQRWFFVSPAEVDAVGTDLLAALRKSAPAGINGDANGILDDRLRIYAAPTPLCQLRIAVRDPEAVHEHHVDIEGEGGIRVPLSTERAAAIKRAFMRAVERIERTDGDATIEGFRRWKPPPGGS